MGYGKILVTLDGSPLAERALEQVLHIAAPEAWVHILSVLTENRVAEMAAINAAVIQVGALGDSYWRLAYEFDPQEKAARENYLRGIADRLVQAKLSVTCELQHGDVVDKIAEVARGGFDVIVIATHSRSGLGKAVLGSVTESVLRRVTCPILIVPNSAASAE